MDHLPHPRGGHTSPMIVPLLRYQPEFNTAASDYDFPPDHTYRCGFEYNDRTAEDVASFAQSFLYFGLLSRLVRRIVEPAHLALDAGIPAHGDRCLSSAKLAPLMREYLSQRGRGIPQEGQMLPETFFSIESRLVRLLAQATENLQALERIAQPVASGSLPVVLLSIGVLIETIWATCSLYSGPMPDYNLDGFQPSPPMVHGDICAPASAKLLCGELEQNGWCPTQARRLLCEHPYSTCYYLSRVRRHARESVAGEHEGCREHAVCRDSPVCVRALDEGDGGGCTGGRCVAYNLSKQDMERYEPRHVGDCAGGCKTIQLQGKELERLARLIKEGKVPLVSVDTSRKGGDMKLRIRECRYDDKYVALSHVWSDRRGNVEVNGLPACQLRQLLGYLSDAPGTALLSLMEHGSPPHVRYGINHFLPIKYFWMDTLCILPGQPKLRAINMIPAVFAGASHVLVLDREMEQLRLADADWAEIAGRLAYSAWAGRSWTFEEAGFGSACWVQMADGRFDPRAANNRHGMLRILGSNPIFEKPARNAIAAKMRRSFFDTPDEKEQYVFRKRIRALVETSLEAHLERLVSRTVTKPADDDESLETFNVRRFVNTSNSLSYRQTSVPLDKLTIFVHMLNMNPFEVIGAPAVRQTQSKMGDAGDASGLPGPDPKAIESAMIKIVKSVEYLPIPILYQGGLRARPGSDHDYRWLPLYPSGEPYAWDRQGWMEWKTDGLHLPAKPAFAAHESRPAVALMLFKQEQHGDDDAAAELALKETLGRFITRRAAEWKVTFMRSKPDEMAKKHFLCSAIVFEPPGTFGKTLRGACFQVIDMTATECGCPRHTGFGIAITHRSGCEGRDSKLSMVCRYDCPVRLTPVSGGKVTKDPSPAWRVPSPWMAVMKCDTKGIDSHPQERPELASFRVASAASTVINTIPSLGSMVATILLFVVLVRSFRDMTALAQTAAVLHFLSVPLDLVPVVNRYCSFVVVIIACLFAGGEAMVGRLTGLSLAYVVLALLGNLTLGVLRLTWLFYLDPILYDEWIRTYSFLGDSDEDIFRGERNRRLLRYVPSFWRPGLINQA